MSDEPPQSHTITYDDRIGVLACNSIDTLSVHKVDALGRLFMTSFRPQDTQCTTAPGHSPYGTRPWGERGLARPHLNTLQPEQTMVLRILLSGRRPLRLTSWGFKCQMPQQSLSLAGFNFPGECLQSRDCLTIILEFGNKRKDPPSESVHTLSSRGRPPRIQETCTQEPPWHFAPLFREISTRYGRYPDRDPNYIWMIKNYPFTTKLFFL